MKFKSRFRASSDSESLLGSSFPFKVKVSYVLALSDQGIFHNADGRRGGEDFDTILWRFAIRCCSLSPVLQEKKYGRDPLLAVLVDRQHVPTLAVAVRNENKIIVTHTLPAHLPPPPPALPHHNQQHQHKHRFGHTRVNL